MKKKEDHWELGDLKLLVVMKIMKYQYNNAPGTTISLLNDLLLSVWEDIDVKEIHSKEMNAVSFCAIKNNRFIGYVGVVS